MTFANLHLAQVYTRLATFGDFSEKPGKFGVRVGGLYVCGQFKCVSKLNKK